MRSFENRKMNSHTETKVISPTFYLSAVGDEWDYSGHNFYYYCCCFSWHINPYFAIDWDYMHSNTEIQRHKQWERVAFNAGKKGGRGVLHWADFIRASSDHKKARQELDYWEMEVCCRVTVTVAGGGWVVTTRWYHQSSALFCLDEEAMLHPWSCLRARWCHLPVRQWRGASLPAKSHK